LVLCLGDHFFHVRTGILVYHWSPLIDRQSIWVWLVFTAAAAAMVASTLMFPLRDLPGSMPWARMLDAGLLFVGSYALSGQLGGTHPTVLFWSLVAAWALRLLAHGSDIGSYALYGLLLAAVGVVGEGLFSMAGLFDYQLQQVLRCPWWLAGLYLNGSVALLEIARGARYLSNRQ
jgi:hypothetical protein